ncbi:hypothetical protein FNZ56_10785 [Pseudoluteimonas lycopersici]|uniref:Uncharacterized protein n=1 Tax=Pseudoluteimonas lycopersici TaxID=1324796 RepID=A0A516V756_9GAMM|nr:hypothetical protein [Lysobacter lycopersici]QDQ74331.1 hypothetical protein FNZ56_10785 [Lysobacter lycopersici]
MTTPTQNQKQNQNPQDKQQQAQGRKDDMHNTGAQAQNKQPSATAGKDADRDVQQRKDAPKPGQNH